MTTQTAALIAYAVHIEGEGEIATVTASDVSQALDLAAEEIAQGDWLDDGETATTVAYWIVDAGTRTDGSVTITAAL